MVKLWCSCVRDQAFRERLERHGELLLASAAPREGDLVVVRALADKGAYREVEELSGREVRLYEGDEFVGVLGTRQSGRNLTGVVPPRPLRRGDTLSLLAVGGLLGEVTAIPHYYGDSALPVSLLGFLSWDGRPANLRDGQRVAARLADAERKPIALVVGTSAETGKTTFICNALRAIRRRRPELRAAALKACGTGRLRDLFRYSDAGAAYVTDFVAAGWPSTYNVPAETYVSLLEGLVAASLQEADVVFIEVGGDLLEARAPEAIELTARLDVALTVLVVNDALGARAGLALLRERGIEGASVASMHQNPLALAHRLEVPEVIDPLDVSQVGKVLAPLLVAERVTEVAS